MEKPYEPPIANAKTESPHPKPSSVLLIIVEPFLVVAIISGMVIFLLPAVTVTESVCRPATPSFDSAQHPVATELSASYTLTINDIY